MFRSIAIWICIRICYQFNYSFPPHQLGKSLTKQINIEYFPEEQGPWLCCNEEEMSSRYVCPLGKMAEVQLEQECPIDPPSPKVDIMKVSK